MPRNESETTTIIPSIPSAIAPSERKKQLSIALGEENWPRVNRIPLPV